MTELRVHAQRELYGDLLIAEATHKNAKMFCLWD
jgi:hypothetical protein